MLLLSGRGQYKPERLCSFGWRDVRFFLEKIVWKGNRYLHRIQIYQCYGNLCMQWKCGKVINVSMEERLCSANWEYLMIVVFIKQDRWKDILMPSPKGLWEAVISKTTLLWFDSMHANVRHTSIANTDHASSECTNMQTREIVHLCLSYQWLKIHQP